jgi:hypothetical protein
VPRFVNGRKRAEVIFRKAAYIQQLKGVVADVEVGSQECAGPAATSAPGEQDRCCWIRCAILRRRKHSFSYCIRRPQRFKAQVHVIRVAPADEFLKACSPSRILEAVGRRPAASEGLIRGLKCLGKEAVKSGCLPEYLIGGHGGR